MAPIRGLNLKKLFGTLTPYADDIARGVSSYGDDALRLASNYGDEALDYGLDVAKYADNYADNYADDIARGLGNPKAFGKDVPFDLTPGRVEPPQSFFQHLDDTRTDMRDLSEYLTYESDMDSVRNLLKGGHSISIDPNMLRTYLSSPEHVNNPFADVVMLDDALSNVKRTLDNGKRLSNTLGIAAYPQKMQSDLEDLYKILYEEIYPF